MSTAFFFSAEKLVKAVESSTAFFRFRPYTKRTEKMYGHYLMMKIREKEMPDRYENSRPVKRCMKKKRSLPVYSAATRALALWLEARLIEMGEKLTDL